MKPKIKLRTKDIEKLSMLIARPVETLQQLDAMNLLDTSEARNLLILTDWKNVKNKKQYKTFQIVEALTREYQVSQSKVESIIYEKKASQYWCRDCGKRIPKSEHIRNQGICDKCIIQNIKL